MARSLPLPTSADASIERISSALDERHRARGRERAQPVLPITLAASRFWSERAWSEFAAVPSMAHMTLAAVRDGVPLTMLDTIAMIGRDEVRHTVLSRELAEGFGGYIDQIPDEVACDPQSIAEPCGGALVDWVVSAGCLSETISFELMRTRLAHTTHPMVREILSGILKDEAMHARFAWALAEELLPPLDEALREALAEYAEMQLHLLSQSFGMQGFSREVREHARENRREVASLGLGAAPPDEEDATFDRTKREIIVPRLKDLGIPL